MQVGEYVLENEEKVNRAINGQMVNGRMKGGVGEKATPEAIVAEYDRLGGYITKDGIKVKMGSFFDFYNKKVRKEPDLKFLAEIEGEIIETTEEEAKSIQTAKVKTKELKAKKLKKSKKE